MGRWHTHAEHDADRSGKHLTAKDRNGKILFDGPIDTEEQRAAMPEDIREKLEKLEKQTKIQIHISPAEKPKADSPKKSGSDA